MASARDDRLDDMPERLPIFPLGGVLLFPRSELPLNIFEPRYLRMVSDALQGERLIGMVQPDSERGLEEERDPDATPSVYLVGCAGRITSFTETDDGRMLIVLTGTCRFRIKRELDRGELPYRVVEPDFLPYVGDLDDDPAGGLIDRDALLSTFDEFLTLHGLQADWSDAVNASDEALINALSMISPYEPREKQALLEAVDLKTRAEVLATLTRIALAEKRGGTLTSLQ